MSPEDFSGVVVIVRIGGGPIMDNKLRSSSLLALAAGASLLTGSFSASSPARALEPVSLESGSNSITLSVAGTYRGGFFSNDTPATPPAYDPVTKRLFVGSGDRKAIDVIDISDPARPARLAPIDIVAYGGEPKGLALHKGIIAATIENESGADQVVLFNANGERVTDPILLADANRVAFTPNGRRLVVTMYGSLTADCSRDPDASIAIIELGSVNWGGCRQGAGKCNVSPSVRTAGFTAFNGKKDELIAAGARFYGPDPNITVAQDANPEGLAISADSRFAWVTLERNNAIAKVDLNAAKVTDIYPLGSQDHSQPGRGFDASDKDGGVNIKPWPVRSFYSPDGIAVVGGGRQTYLVTADEGDPKDGECGYGEKFRLKDLVLDETAFPDRVTLQKNENLGRLAVTNASGDTDNDGDLDEIYMLGSRSFSVWTSDGQLVFNSGDAFEQITAQAVPAHFNAAEDENALDARSDDRGPEPEHLAVGEVDGRDYLFVGFERIGGFVVYDITDPTKPVFQQYINNRDFGVDPRTSCGQKGTPELAGCAAVGDLEPEGFVFIPKQDSPSTCRCWR